MLPDAYKHALAALKDQATAALTMATDKAAGKVALADAQRRMSLHDAECKHIVRAVMKSVASDISIPTLSEERLSTMLGFDEART